MRIETVEHKIYKYNELSEEAKKKVKQWYLDGQSPQVFTAMCEDDLYNLFGDNDLEIQYSLGYCQGDGLNIYGKIGVEQIFNCLEKHNGGTQLEKFENVLTDKEKKTISHYAEQCGDIRLPVNNSYEYCMADYIDIKDEWSYVLEYNYNYNNINMKVLEKFETLVKGIFTELCNGFENIGYEYFYEISDEDLEENCNVNMYEFYEDGSVY